MSDDGLPPGTVPPGDDPDLEARLVALIMGEASAFEVEALERLMAKRPEVVVLKRRLEAMHDLMGRAVKPGNDEEWKLAPERRAHVMKTLGIGGTGKGSNGNGEAKEARIRKASRTVLWAAAACVMVNVILFVWVFGRMTESEGMLSTTGAERSMRGEPVLSIQSANESADVESFARRPREPTRGETPPPPPRSPVPHRITGMVADAPSALTVAPEPAEPPGNRAGEALEQLKNSLGPLPGDNIATGGLRSGEDAITRNSIDAILNNPEAPVGGAAISSGRRIEVVPAGAGDDVVEVAEGGFLGKFSEGEDRGKVSIQGRVVAGNSGGEIEEKGPHYAGAVIRAGTARGEETRDKLSLADSEAAAKSPMVGYLHDGTVNVPPAAFVPYSEVNKANGLGDLREGGLASDLSGHFVAGNEGGRRSGNDFILPPARGQIVDGKRRTGDGLLESSVADLPVASGEMLAREQAKRASTTREAEQLLRKGREAYTRGDYDEAVAKYQASLDTLPGGHARSDRRKAIEGHLADGTVAKAQSLRRTGRFEEARKALEDSLKVDPDNQYAIQELEYLDDPIRTNPALTNENTKNVDQVRRQLYTAEGYKNLGLFDQAVEEYQKTLRIDPNNQAARKGMEAVNSLKSDYYRSAYDETRSRLLAQVDEAWEMAVPPAQGANGKAAVPKGDDLVGQTWDVGPTFLRDLQHASHGEDGADADADPFGGDLGGSGSLKARRPLIDILKESGISFPPGATARYDPRSGTLVVNNTEENLQLMNRFAKEILPTIPKTALDENLFKRRSGRGQPGSGAQDFVASKLKNIVIPLIDFEDTTVEDAIDFLRQRARELDSFELDPDKRGLGFRIRKPRLDVGDDELDAEGGLGAIDPGTARVKELKLRNVPMGTALQYICDQAKMRYKITEEGVITLQPMGSGEMDDVVTRTWEIHPDVMAKVREYPDDDLGEPDPFGGEPLTEREKEEQRQQWDDRPLIDIMKDTGIDFPPGSSVLYRPDTKVLIVTNTPSNHDLVDRLFESVAIDMTEDKIEEETLETRASKEPFSTFSLNVSDVSFKLAKASLEKGEWPAPGQIRVEDFVNAFDYGDPAPSLNEKVACRMDQAAHPFMQQRNVIRISMRTAALGRSGGTPLRLTVLLDNSGSMERMDRAEAVRNAFDLLAAQLSAIDEVTLISFARTTRLLADRMTGDQAAQLSQLVDRTPSEGGTNLEQALRVGLAKAQDQWLEGAQNRIILLTDGAANLGNAKAGDLAQLVEEMRQSGIAFDACGVGAEGLNDEILESLTRKGDGRYYLLDRPEDADAGFARQIAGALRPAAKNVKVQVEFNPRRVGRYKLYGFEKHLLEKEDFRNDSVDAAEMAAEESGNALYHYEALPEGEGEVGTVSVRFQDMASGRMVERKWTIPYEDGTPRLAEAAPAVQLAASAVFLGEKLNGSAIGERVVLKEVGRVVNGLRAKYPGSERVRELGAMVAQAREVDGR